MDRKITSWRMIREPFHGWDAVTDAWDRLEDTLEELFSDNHPSDGYYWAPYGQPTIHQNVGDNGHISGWVCQPIIAHSLEDKDGDDEKKEEG